MPDQTAAVTRKVRKPRIRRASASGSERKPRDRALWEVIQIAVVLEEAGLLGGLQPNADGYDETTSAELAVMLQISVVGAKKILRLKAIVRNDDAWKILKKYSTLGVFADFHFTKAYSSIKAGGGTLSTEFIEAFMNGPDGNADKEKIAERARTRKLDSLALSVSAEGRNLLVSMFFSLVAPVATLCSFFSPDSVLDKVKVLDLLGRYLGDSWTSASMQREYQKQANSMCLVNGWNMVSEAMKIQFQELCFWKHAQNNGKEKSETVSEAVEAFLKVSVEDIRQNLFEMCSHVISEFFA